MERIPIDKRLNYICKNNQGLTMQCIEYINSNNIIIKFDNPVYQCKGSWSNFINGKIHNPMVPTVYGVGIRGVGAPIHINGKQCKEYQCWCDLLYRVYSCKDLKTYINCSVCDEWLYYPNFYSWITMQPNYLRWLNGSRWCLDKDILFKHNKLYSPDTCCLVPNNVNTLFVKKDLNRGELPIGVTKNHNRFMALCSNPVIGNTKVYLGTYDNPIEAFMAYKTYKESVIKSVSTIEFNNNNITLECYNAMQNYNVDITD